MPIATPQGTLDFKSVDKVTFVGASSNTVIDTTTGSLGVGVDVNGPTSNLHVVGNAFVSSNLIVSENVGVGTVSPLVTLDTHGTMRSSAPYPRFDFYTTTNRSTNAWGNSTDNAGDYRIYSNGDASDGTKRSLNFDYGQNSTHTTRMTINANGNVGIGASNPSKTLVVGGDVAFPQSVTSTDYSHNTTDRALYIGGKDSNGSLTQAKCAIISSPTNGGAQQYGRNALHFCVGPDSQDDVNASVSNSKLSIDHSGKVIVNGTLQIQGFDAKRVLIGYQKFENAGGTSWAATQTGWQNAWSVNYVRKKAGSQIYVTCDLCMAQAMGANGTVSYRHIDGRLKVYDQVTDRYSNSTRDWQRIDNSFHEYQRQSRIYYGPHTLPGAQAGWTVTVVAQVERSSGTGSLSSWGINIWSGRSVIEVYETMEA